MISKILVFVLVTATYVNAQTYNAAVLEYAPEVDSSLTPEENVLLNTQRYVNFIGQANSQGSNIIVFPEYGLTTMALPSNLSTISTNVPQASLRVIPCLNSENYTKFFIDLSCAAREHAIHVVVNLIESDVRNNTDGTNTTIFYNTNVVFDRTGAVIARYRKINLFNEPMLTPGSEVVTFTAFDITFGLMTCFDIMFRIPAQELFRNNVTDVVYPMAWISEVPFAHVLSIQEGYATASGINFLVSGYNNVTSGIAGAGIFRANGTIAALSLESAAVQNIFFGSLSRITTRTPEASCINITTSTRIGGTVPDLTKSLNVIHENMENYTFVALERNVNSTQGIICSEGSTFCCNYSIEFSSPLTTTSTVYKMVAFHGRRGLPGVTLVNTFGIRVCGLVACTSEANTDCGRLNGTTNVNFRSISISTATEDNNTIYQPTTLTYNHQPLTDYAYCSRVESGITNITIAVNNPQSLFSIGFFGREYAADGQIQGRGAAGVIQFSMHLIIALVSASFCLTFAY